MQDWLTAEMQPQMMMYWNELSFRIHRRRLANGLTARQYREPFHHNKVRFTKNGLRPFY